MNHRLNSIIDYITTIDGIEITIPFREHNYQIRGGIKVKESDVELNFDVIIGPQYPFQFHETDTIQFINTDLLSFSHVNKNGSICIHTSHSSKLKDKLSFDFASLKQWINKYYLAKEQDIHYEHIIVPQGSYNNNRINVLFTDVDYQFQKGDFGTFKYSLLSDYGNHEKINLSTYIIQSFQVNGKDHSSKWSYSYRKIPHEKGIFLFIENPPVKNKRFIIENWKDLEPYTSNSFLSYLYNLQRVHKEKKYSGLILLLIGYKISLSEIHWQCVAINSNSYLINRTKILGTRSYVDHFIKDEINWQQTKNCSYKYFFGRGTLSNKLTESKILIIGIGAIGSIVANTLTRGGCKFISLVDYDIKEPENVCRSEYSFNTGLNSKVSDLINKLLEISPFVELTPLNELFTDGVKYSVIAGINGAEITQTLNNYDFIFDCSTDDDIAFILDSYKLEASVINLSITNYAKELVCVVNPELYNWMNEIYSRLDKQSDDFYNPTGCWSPTFKASYNDVSLMVQFAIKQINTSLISEMSLRNFYLQLNSEDTIDIKIHPF